jgi:hypothetical protein
MAELLEAVASWPSLVLVIVMFGFAPGFCLRLIVLAYPRSDPRRAELIAELYAVPRIQRPLWVAEQLEVALFEGLAHRPLAHRPPGQQQAVPPPEIAPPPEPKPDEAGAADWDTSKETYDLVRPYSLTEGRNASCVDLAVGTLVSATGHPPNSVARPEHHTLLRLCATPHSVAELAALLSMPLGVARVLLGDLAAAGSIAVHRTVGSAEAAPDVALMQRVLTALQRP